MVNPIHHEGCDRERGLGERRTEHGGEARDVDQRADEHADLVDLPGLVRAQDVDAWQERLREEAQALWTAALHDAPRFRMPFDVAWWEQVIAERRAPDPRDDERTIPASPAARASLRRESWGEAPDITGFLGRV